MVRISAGTKLMPKAKHCAPTMPATAMIEPIERSISPSRMTQVIPKAAMAITDTCCRMLRKFATDMKRWLVTEKMTHSTISDRKIPPYCFMTCLKAALAALLSLMM